jgi:hypothetical protein
MIYYLIKSMNKTKRAHFYTRVRNLEFRFTFSLTVDYRFINKEVERDELTLSFCFKFIAVSSAPFTFFFRKQQSTCLVELLQVHGATLLRKLFARRPES